MKKRSFSHLVVGNYLFKNLILLVIAFFCLIDGNRLNAQVYSNPLPQMKSKANALTSIQTELQSWANWMASNPNRTPGNSGFENYKTMVEAYIQVNDFLVYQNMTVEQAVASVFTQMNSPISSNQTLDFSNYFNRNWSPAFTELVNKLRI